MPISKNAKYFISTITFLLALLTAMSPLAIDTYLSSMPVMANFFGVQISKVEISLTVYFLGFALGNFIGGPLSDAFGRKPLAVTGILLYSISAFLIPYCQTMEQVWILRAIQAFGGGFSSVTAMVFVRDWFKGKQVAKLATLITMIMMFAPLLAPVIGTALSQHFGWQSIFHFLGIYAAALLVLFVALMPESRDASLITRKLTGRQFVEKYHLFFQSKPAILLLFTLAFSVSGMFVFITGSSFMYLEYFGFEAHVFPFLFGANVVLNVGLSLLNNRFLKRYNPQSMIKMGLLLQLLAGTGLLFSTLATEVHFIPVFASIVLYVGSLGMVFGNGTAMMLNLLPQISGSANAMIGVTRFIISFIVGSIPSIFYNGSLMPIGITMFGCSVLGILFFFWFTNNQQENHPLN